jgi:hypothetical protein
MRVLVFTVPGDIVGGADSEFVEFECEPDDRRLVYIGLFDPEIIRADRRLSPSMRFPDLFDYYGDDCEIAYYIADRLRFIRFCEMSGLAYELFD